jgi:hypothetical protein
MQNIISSEVSQFQKDKSHTWNLDPIQIQQYYEKQVTLSRVTHKRGRVKEGS